MDFPSRLHFITIVTMMVDLQLFLVYFWQMESVTVYVCGLPSVDPRVF